VESSLRIDKNERMIEDVDVDDLDEVEISALPAI
jgi:hypothetical protein